MAEVSILVIRANDSFTEHLRAEGFDTTNLELVSTRPLADQSELLKFLSCIEEYDGIFFTSPAAAEVFTGLAAATVVRSRLYAMGERAKNTLRGAGYEIRHSNAGANTAAEFVNSFDDGEFAGKKLLFVRGDRSMLTIPTVLRDRATVDEVVVYETVEIRPGAGVAAEVKKRLKSGQFGWICFFSPSGIESFCKLFGRRQTSKVGVIGTSTAAAAAKNGMGPDFVSPRSSASEFSRALVGHINGN